MSKVQMTRAAACQLLGCSSSELVDVLDSPAGPVFRMSDGNRYINVAEDTPDADGKSGLMFLEAPSANYQGQMAVFVNSPEVVAAADDAEDGASAAKPKGRRGAKADDAEDGAKS